MRNGFAFLHMISWNPYNEAKDLIAQAKKYKQEYGCYPERICADRIYINTKNRNFCTRNNIRLSGKRLGRPPKDPAISAAHKQLLISSCSAQTSGNGMKSKDALAQESASILSI